MEILEENHETFLLTSPHHKKNSNSNHLGLPNCFILFEINKIAK